MASRRFFGYDPYDYYYPSPANYTYPYYHNPAAFQDFENTEPAVGYSSPYSYYHHRPASARAPAPAARNQDAFFRDVESPEPVMRDPRRRSSRPVAIPVHVTGPDPEPPKKRVPSAEEAAVTVQAAARGLLARRMMREVRAVEREAEAVAARVAAEAEALRADPRKRIGVGEELMRLVLRLDAVHGVREYRKRVTRKVLALQDAVDALEAKPAQATEMPVEAEAESLAAETVEMSETHDAVETGMAPELPQTGEGVHNEDNVAAGSSETVEIEMDMEIDGGKAEEADPEPTDTIAAELEMVGEQAAEAEGEWEMVTGDDAFAGENPSPSAQQQEAAAGEETEKEKKTEAATADGLDAKKVMEMVAALCERSAQQCELIGALAARVDTLERAVRRMDDARRRRKIKKIKEGKSNSKAARSFYSD